ncbi:RDD family protein [Lachnospiraceae bacterium WCA-9-b2]|uniref:RDD family protein n=1 Tax=Sporofaciens musculi TaxID=2681861 RepID=A0A7X3SL41_9FIRM|nr:RDD family protein [Sporofaciens musculi]MXP78011.1 RDD family protein [Sporofaciens musculi]
MQNNYGNRGDQELEFAGFWVRLAAYFLDLGIVWIGLVFVNLVIGIFSIATGQVFKARILFQYTLKDIILYFVQVMYFILLTYHTGTTPGKRLMNLRVVYADKSQRLGLINVIYRETVGRFLCGLSIGIGYIMAGVDREKRGLHDMLCDTRVIYGKRIKVITRYQAPRMYPPIPPAPPFGRPPGGNGPSVYDGVSPYKNEYGPIPPKYPQAPHESPGDTMASRDEMTDGTSVNGMDK